MLSAAKLARCLTPLRFVLYGKQATSARGLVWAKKAIAMPGFLRVRVCSLASQATSATHPILRRAVFHGGRRTFLAQRHHAIAIFSRHSTSSLIQILVDVPLPSPTSDAPELTEDDSSSMQQLLLDQ